VSCLLIDRPRATVWEEYAQVHHPAWCDHPEGEGLARRVGEAVGMQVGAASVSLVPPMRGTGIRNMAYFEVKQVEPGHAVSTESIVTGVLEAVETIRFMDHSDGGTLVELSSWVNTVPLTENRAERLRYNLERIQRGFLARAQTWTPGIPHRPNIVAPEPEDFANLGYP
jgi:hypothetical protein